MDQHNDNYGLLAAFSTVLPLDGPAKPPCVNPVVEESTRPRDQAKVPVNVDDDELITGAGGAYL